MKRVLRPFFKKVASLLGIPGIHNRLNKLEEQISPSGLAPNIFTMMERRLTDLVMAQMTHVHDEIALASAHAENRLISLNESLVSYVNAKQDQQLGSMADFVDQQAVLIAELRQSLDAVRRQVSALPALIQESSTNASSPRTIQTESVIDDGLYVALENHFRGSRDLVAQRQSDYLPMLPEVITTSEPLIDLGCGRGEWLRIMRDQKIPYLGVDSNSVCIAECEEEGLSVVQQDLIEFLASRPNNSVGTYTLFQVLEHLPFPVLVTALREMRRTLVTGGRVIAEVPNAKNLRVSAGTFWIDPTHQRPLFPELLLFLATEVGFTQARGHYANYLSPIHDLTGLPDGARNALHSVIEAVDGPGDFALIATA